MISSKKSVSQYLAMVKTFALNEFVISPRPKNQAFLLAWGIDFETAKDIVLRLTASDYVKGPCEDDRELGRSDVWVFGKRLEWDGLSVEAYIKLTVSVSEDGLGCLCVSFHEREHPLAYAFGGGEREVYLLP